MCDQLQMSRQVEGIERERTVNASAGRVLRRADLSVSFGAQKAAD